MEKHSPLPWSILKEEDSENRKFVDANNNDVITGSASGWEVEDIWTEYTEEDGAFVLKAVNNHDRLMEFVKEISKHVSKAGYQPTCSPFCIHCEATRLLKTIEKEV